MRLIDKRGGFLFLLLFFSGLFSFTQLEGLVNDPLKVNEDIQLTKIDRFIYIHTSWYSFPNLGRYPSNGLIYIKNNKALLIDTPNNDKQTEELYNYLLENMQVKVIKLIIGHSHSDCLGGLGFLQKKGVESVSGDLTSQECIKNGLPLPLTTFKVKLIIDFEGEEIICQYFGPGHTRDNIVVFFPKARILFGGCLIKGAAAKGLGYIKEANIEEWDKTIKKIIKEFNPINMVIPGHGKHGGKELLFNTIRLVELYKGTMR